MEQQAKAQGRFWAKVAVGDGCWLWTAAIDEGTGYGHFRMGPAMVGAHCAAWLLEMGPIPAGLEVCHRCDNPACVRPSHLFLGTHAENMADMTTKGRQAHGPVLGDGRRGDRNGTRTRPDRVARGVDQGSAKLDDDKVREIRARAAAGESQRSIGRAFGIAHVTVARIVHRKYWTHVEVPRAGEGQG